MSIVIYAFYGLVKIDKFKRSNDVRKITRLLRIQIELSGHLNAS